MTYHIHLGVLAGFIAFLYVLLFGTLFRLVATHLHDNAIGQAMAFMY